MYPRKFAIKKGKYNTDLLYSHSKVIDQRTKSLLNLFDQVTENFPKCFTAAVSFFS